MNTGLNQAGQKLVFSCTYEGEGLQMEEMNRNPENVPVLTRNGARGHRLSHTEPHKFILPISHQSYKLSLSFGLEWGW